MRWFLFSFKLYGPVSLGTLIALFVSMSKILNLLFKTSRLLLLTILFTGLSAFVSKEHNVWKNVDGSLMSSPWFDLKTGWPLKKKQYDLRLEELVVSTSAPALSRSQILADVNERIAVEFNIPDGFENRVGFWFDIYSLYDSKKYIIHHRDYPWIVYEVFDADEIFEKKRATWLNRVEADKKAAQKRHQIVKILKNLSRKKSFDKLSDDEQQIYDLFADLHGSKQKIFKIAARSVRTQLGQKDFFIGGLVNSAPYIPVMEEIFIQKGLPRELVRIPLVESSFNISAHSKVGAKGVWQIMPAVGKSGMLINDRIDERMSPLKSTDFAAKLLRLNYKILKNWPLAVTAYNHGVGSLIKATHKIKTNDLMTIIDKYEADSFQFASSNFYACFLAALHAETYRDHLFPDLILSPSLDVKQVHLAKAQRLSEILKKSGLSLEQLKDINPDLKNKNISARTSLPRGFKFFVPSQNLLEAEKGFIVRDFAQNKEDLKSQKPVL